MLGNRIIKYSVIVLWCAFFLAALIMAVVKHHQLIEIKKNKAKIENRLRAKKLS